MAGDRSPEPSKANDGIAVCDTAVAATNYIRYIRRRLPRSIIETNVLCRPIGEETHQFDNVLHETTPELSPKHVQELIVQRVVQKGNPDADQSKHQSEKIREVNTTPPRHNCRPALVYFTPLS